MAKKVMLDAGHYGHYNRSPAIRDYYESLMNWELHLYLKAALESYGIQVGHTRTDQTKDRALYDRGYASKGYDLFISVHSNAAGSAVNEAIDYPVCMCQVSGKSDKIGMALAECVGKTMQTEQKARIFKRALDSGGDYYGVLRGAAAAGTVGVIVEHSFHTCTRMTRWLMDSANLRKMANAEARIIADYLGVGGGSVDVAQWYRVRKSWAEPASQLGAYKKKENAVASCPVGYGVYDEKGNCVFFRQEAPAFPYQVRVTIDDLRIRKGAGTNNASVGFTGKGVFTIVAEDFGEGADKWGKLKSGVGWIALDDDWIEYL